MIFLIGISFIIIIIFWVFEEEGINVRPFEVIGIEDNSDGKAFAFLLSFDLERIKDIYSEPGKSGIPESKDENKTIPRPLRELSTLSSCKLEMVPLDYSISQIGTLGVGGASLSIGNIALCIKEFIGNKANTLTCSLQRYNSTVTAVAILKYRTNADTENASTEIMTFQVTANISNDEQIPDIINDLAFQIALALGKRHVSPEKDHIFPQNWQTYKYVTQGRDAYNIYMMTKDINDLDKAYDMASSAKKFKPEYNGTYELLSGIGFAYLEKGNYSEAENIFRDITEFEPFKSAFGLGMAYYSQENYPEALEAFKKATQLDSEEKIAWNNLGVTLNKLKNYSDAIEAFDNAINIDLYAAAWFNKGNALAYLARDENNSSRYEEAIEAYSKAIEIGSQDAALSAKAWSGKCNVFNALGDYNNSTQACGRAIEINSQYVDAWINKGYALFNQGKPDEALEACNESIRLSPNESKAWNLKGVVLASQGETDEAINSFDKAIILDPNLPEAWLYKSFALWSQGSNDEAQEAYDEATRLDPKLDPNVVTSLG